MIREKLPDVKIAEQRKVNDGRRMERELSPMDEKLKLWSLNQKID